MQPVIRHKPFEGASGLGFIVNLHWTSINISTLSGSERMERVIRELEERCDSNRAD
jgi:hypothetical protein